MLTLGSLSCLGIIGWIILGALAGWLAGLIAGTRRRQGCFWDIVVGIAGALIGGFLFFYLLGVRETTGFIGSLVIAVIGAVILLVIVKAIRGRR